MCCAAVLVTAKDADKSYRMVIKVTSHHCLFWASWSKKLPESACGAGAVLATMFNNKLIFKLVMLDVDVRDGEVRLRCALPVGVMAKDPKTMIAKYLEMLRLVTVGVLGVIASVDTWKGAPVEAGAQIAKATNLVLAAFLNHLTNT